MIPVLLDLCSTQMVCGKGGGGEGGEGAEIRLPSAQSGMCRDPGTLERNSRGEPRSSNNVCVPCTPL